MKDWKITNYSDTIRDFINNTNVNSENGEFIDGMIGTIIGNGILFNGKETIDDESILPLTNVKSSGIVNSDTIFDNFTLYFKDENKIVELNLFPIDFLSFNDGKIHFLFIKSDLTYRISDYMFGRADEVLIGRFMINLNSTWNHFYIMAQRGGTSTYDLADEFYNVDELYVKSPRNLELSQVAGTVKRSGIQFNSYNSPDIFEFNNLITQRVPIRYINTNNEIDYSVSQTYNVITNRYMTYNMNKKLKIKAENIINNIRNLYYRIVEYTKTYTDELNTAILAEEDNTVKQKIIDNFLIKINEIYEQAEQLSILLEDSVLSSVDRTYLNNNIASESLFVESYLEDIPDITAEQITYMNELICYIKNIDSSVYDNPLSTLLDDIQDDLNEIVFPAGTLANVETGKFTIQRILWDIYDGSLILQYGDTVYNTFNDAIAASNLVEYPAPWYKTVYIPLAIIIIKSGTTSINEDDETLIISRRDINVDQMQEDFADYIARALARKALNKANEVEEELSNMVTVPIGGGLDFYGETAPEGFLFADGSAVSKTEYAKLYAVIGDIYRNSNNLDTATFNLPDKRTRVSVMKDTSDSDFNTLGKKGGEKAHTLSTNEIPAHKHTLTDPGHKHITYNKLDQQLFGDFDWNSSPQTFTRKAITAITFNAGIESTTSSTGITMADSGGGQAHNNLQPYLVCNYIIRAK